MPVITRQLGPCFAAEVEGVDLTKPLAPDEVAAIHAGMDRYAVLVVHDQRRCLQETLVCDPPRAQVAALLWRVCGRQPPQPALAPAAPLRRQRVGQSQEAGVDRPHAPQARRERQP